MFAQYSLDDCSVALVLIIMMRSEMKGDLTTTIPIVKVFMSIPSLDA